MRRRPKAYRDIIGTMKNRLLLTAVFPLVFVAAGSSFAFAQANEPSAENNTEQANNSEETDKTKLKQRIEERKNRLQTRLDSGQFARISERCSGAQGKLSSLVVRFENSDKPYRVKYENYLRKLETLQIRLDQKDIDTAQLDANIVALEEKIQSLKTSVDQYVQSVNDAKAVDCKNDPTGFRAALDDAKNYAAALKAARADLETYARETIKTTIEQVKVQHKASQEQEQEQGE